MNLFPCQWNASGGGRELAKLYKKSLPANSPIGETWEIVDRPEAQSLVKAGEWQGHSLHDLWSNHREGIFGEIYGGYPAERFPILVKLLDARETLSVQVHPPAHRAAELGGEPKTEMWYFMECDAGACIYAGVKEGITKATFEELLRNGNVEEALPNLPVRRGESIFIPSGRLHAIGGGNVIAEIQQNSDTTYRVFDWNRMGLDGKPRELHIVPSLESIDFSDQFPKVRAPGAGVLAACDYFRVEEILVTNELSHDLNIRFHIWGIVEGTVKIGVTEYQPGTFLFLPVGLEAEVSSLPGGARVLDITLPFSS